MTTLPKTSLLQALSRMLNTPVADADYTAKLLQGGDVGEVYGITGTAELGGTQQPFALVLKKQKQWHRHGDPDCWRREYEIYRHGLDRALLPVLHLPACYLLEESETMTCIWMEYVEGATGWEQLQLEDLALAAERLGELQAEFHLHGPRDLPYLRAFPAVRSSFDLWWGYAKKPLASARDDFPESLRQRLNDYAARAASLLASFDALPRTLCQGDFYHDNIFCLRQPEAARISVIDWDGAGYGHMGEDAVDILMESFVYSERDLSLLPVFRREIIAAYGRGAKNRGLDFQLSDELVRDLFALAWGFRIASLNLNHYKEDHARRRCLDILRLMLDEER